MVLHDLQLLLSIVPEGHTINVLVTVDQGSEFESRSIPRHAFHYYVITQ
jgi:hypothetical protein